MVDNPTNETSSSPESIYTTIRIRRTTKSRIDYLWNKDNNRNEYRMIDDLLLALMDAVEE